jgi:hypothetical protein
MGYSGVFLVADQVQVSGRCQRVVPSFASENRRSGAAE